MNKWHKPQPPPVKSTRLATILSIIAIILSGSSWWLNYLTSLPAMAPKVELVEPLAAGQKIHFKVLIDNTGKTVAKQLHPSLAFMFSRSDIPFTPNYDAPTPTNWTATVSDLPAGGHTTLYTVNDFSLAHDHDVNAVIAGGWRLYVYGKIRYKDALHIPHEVHFCGFYQQITGAEPLKLSYCESYNETD
jgi:hypothetical protein